MIIFLGDSFTWGQGLYFEKWLDEGRTPEFCNLRMPPAFPQENMSYEDDLYRRTYHFPNLVAKHFNKSYVTKWGNGGSNLDIINILKNIRSQMYYPYGIDFVVVQFTDFTRRDNRPEFDFNGYTEKFNSIEELYKNQVDEVAKLLPDVDWYGISWLDEIGSYLKTNYPKNHIDIEYEDKVFTNFHDLYYNFDSLLLRHRGIADSHFNKKGHQILAKNIIEKINKYGKN